MDQHERVHPRGPAEMPMKKWFRRIHPTPSPLYVILVLSLVFFAASIVISHTSHSLTLLMVSYHMLCNIIALAGCIATITKARGKSLRQEIREENSKKQISESSSNISTISNGVIQQFPGTPGEGCQDAMASKASVTQKNQENKLKNTFGWTRIDVLVMLICCVFLASLSFSLIVEALQTLFHISHQDEMHNPILVLSLGLSSIVLNIICYILIGGYTFHQGSFLYLNPSGDVVLSKVTANNQSVSGGERRLSRSKMTGPVVHKRRQRQGFKEMTRDLFDSIMVIITSLLVNFLHEDIGKYIDPALSIVSSLVILILSFPYMRESCLILLQTIPDTMNIEAIQKELLKSFPDVHNVHDFHIWQLTTNKVISTVHIIFQNPRVYSKIIGQINEFFADQGVTQLTIQPEFYTNQPKAMDVHKNCLMKCKGEGCAESHCCPHETHAEAPSLKEAIKGAQSLESVQVVSTKEKPLENSEKSKSADDCSELSKNKTVVSTDVIVESESS